LKCNFTSILERLDFVILKNMYKDITSNKIPLSQRSQSKVMPLVVVPTFVSQIFKHSVSFKGSMLWNKLPKNIVLNTTGYEKFKKIVFEWIIAKRNNVFTC